MFIYKKNGKLNISFDKKTIPDEIVPDIKLSREYSNDSPPLSKAQVVG